MRNHDEAYRVVPETRTLALQKLGVTVHIDLFANKDNHEEALWCSPRWSAFQFNWQAMFDSKGVLWCNPPFTKLKHVLTKVALEKCKIVVVSPEWEDAKSQDWHRLLDRLTIDRVKLDPHEGSLFLSDDGKRLPTPSWTYTLSLLDSRANRVDEGDLDPLTVKWVKERSQNYSVEKLEEYCGGQCEEENTSTKPGSRTPTATCTTRAPRKERETVRLSVPGPNKNPPEASVVEDWLSNLEMSPEDECEELSPLDVEQLSYIDPTNPAKTCKQGKAMQKAELLEILDGGGGGGHTVVAGPEVEALVSKYDVIFQPFKKNVVNPMVCEIKVKQENSQKMLMARGYKLSEEDQKEMTRQVKDLEQRGFIEHIPEEEHPQFLSPAMLVSKQDGTKRMVVDYSALNHLLEPCALPLPVMEPLLDKLGSCAWKSKMDLQSGFWQCQLTTSSRALTSFILPNQEVLRYCVLPMGLSVSPGIFQRHTTRLVNNFKQSTEVGELLRRGAVVEVLMDDFLLGTKTLEDHLQLLELWFAYKPSDLSTSSGPNANSPAMNWWYWAGVSAMAPGAQYWRKSPGSQRRSPETRLNYVLCWEA